MRVLIADERSAHRRALRALLEHDPQCEQIIEAPDAPSALAALPFEPDIMLLEWELPGLPAAVLLDRLRRERPELVVVVMGRHARAREAALAVGVDQFVDVAEPPAHFMAWLHDLCAAHSTTDPLTH